jgi:hypothetical protein
MKTQRLRGLGEGWTQGLTLVGQALLSLEPLHQPRTVHFMLRFYEGRTSMGTCDWMKWVWPNDNRLKGETRQGLPVWISIGLSVWHPSSCMSRALLIKDLLSDKSKTPTSPSSSSPTPIPATCTGDGTHGLVLIRQVLHDLSLQSFGFSMFFTYSLSITFPRLASDHDPPVSTSWDAGVIDMIYYITLY